MLETPIRERRRAAPDERLSDYATRVGALALGERLGLPADRVVDCIETLGNASAATLPVALAAAESDGRLRPGARVLLSAFVAGFTWGGGVIEWRGGHRG